MITSDIDVEAFTQLIIEFCQENFDTPREAAAFLKDFFDIKPEWERIIGDHNERL